MSRVLTLIAITSALISSGNAPSINPNPSFHSIMSESSYVEVVETTDPLVIEDFTITAYCGCKKCCGEYASNRPKGVVYGAYGIELKQGVSVASPLPKGTKLEIDGLKGTYVVQDTTAGWVVDKYKGKIIDVYFNSHQQALDFAKKTDIKVTILKGES